MNSDTEDASIIFAAVAVIVTFDSPAAVPVTVMLSLDAETLTAAAVYRNPCSWRCSRRPSS